MLVKGQGLVKSYGHKLIFKNVEFEAKKGEIVLLLGANGSGKSTLLKIIAGALRPTAGEVNIDPDSASIGYMGHDTFLYPQLTALENILFWCKLYGKKANRELVHTWLKRFGLGSFLHERVSRFSRGMAQKLNFVRVMSTDPDILLLDEPVTGLDKESRQLFREEVLNLKQMGMLVFWVTHFPEQNFALSDKALQIKDKTAAYLATSDN